MSNAPQIAGLDAPLLVDVKGLSRLTSLSTRTLWRLRSAGKLPGSVKIGSRVVWSYESIRLWVDAGCPESREARHG